MDVFSEISYSAVLAAAGPLLLCCFILVPQVWANLHVKYMALAAKVATYGAFALAILSALNLAFAGPTQQLFIKWGGVGIGVYFDVLSAILLLLVSFLGLIVTRYTLIYLQGDPRQGFFLKWLCVSLGAVLALVVAGNLAQFTGAWILTSLSLNMLLTFYSDRPAALIAARKKFVISRLGDVCLLGAIYVTWQVFGTLEFSELFAKAQLWRETGTAATAGVTMLCLLLVGGAALKSAQFPFHSWLPDTMETPTPVSALMHAGIINAGGFLIIRLSPVVSLSPLALNALVLIGAVTAVFAAVVMMTQASIKRMLAFSTISQMGFMLLQCGLGAYYIAVLHIVAHSLYKAHAFLTSGSVVAISKSSWVPDASPAAHPLVMAGALASALVLFFAAASIFGVAPQSEPGLLVLSAVFIMALAHLLWSLWGHSLSPRLVVRGLIMGAAVSVGYFALHVAFKGLLQPVLPQGIMKPVGNSEFLLLAVVVLFGAVLTLQSQLPQWAARPWCRSLYVHARNGFYFNTLANRAIQAVWPAR